jgi:ribosome-associated protein
MMTREELELRGIENEIAYFFSRSGGPGGQNVNKLNTKAGIRFNISLSSVLTEYEKERLLHVLKKRITAEGDLLITSQEERSQADNREKALEKFYKLICSALTPVKKRRATSPTRLSRERRLRIKKIKSLIKRNRQGKPQSDE